ncbi:hypothetical protein KKF61_08695 [Patescibacteria group bacterium]|nr:hypothetical protein [Patescibacteria group bacterium]
MVKIVKRINKTWLKNGEIIILKHFENKPLVVKNYKEDKISDIAGNFSMITFDIVSKDNPKVKETFILRSDWFKDKNDLLAKVRADLNYNHNFKSKLASYSSFSYE